MKTRLIWSIFIWSLIVNCGLFPILDTKEESDIPWEKLTGAWEHLDSGEKYIDVFCCGEWDEIKKDTVRYLLTFLCPDSLQICDSLSSTYIFQVEGKYLNYNSYPVFISATVETINDSALIINYSSVRKVNYKKIFNATLSRDTLSNPWRYHIIKN